MTLYKRQSGVGLIEILVTILVIAIGLLGLVGIQTASMKNSNNSHNRALATIGAYDMVERMRSNPAGVKAGNYNAINIDGKTESDSSCTTACSASDMASRDAYQWGQTLKGDFPDGFTGTVVSAGDQHQITVSWTELQAGSENPASAPNFTLNVQIYSP